MAKRSRGLSGMVVVITGASAGIGQSLARQLSAGGARLVMGARRVDRLEALNRELGGGHVVRRCDVGVTADCEALIDAAVESFGRLDTLVCNAGYGEIRPVHRNTYEQVHELFKVNVYGTLDCIRAAVPVMKRQEPLDGWRGQIMLVSSAAARRGLPFLGPYSATKAAQLSIAEAMRVELADKAISVTSVHPIGTQTEFFDIAETRGGKKLPPRITGDRMQTADTVAAAMVRAIVRPRREVWPAPLFRYLLSAVTLLPSVGDRVMAKARAKQINDD